MLVSESFCWRWNFCLVGMSCCEKHPAQFRVPFPRVQLKFDTCLGGSDLVYF